jgi:hypothetical protein
MGSDRFFVTRTRHPVPLPTGELTRVIQDICRGSRVVRSSCSLPKLGLLKFVEPQIMLATVAREDYAQRLVSDIHRSAPRFPVHVGTSPLRVGLLSRVIWTREARQRFAVHCAARIAV